MRPPEEAASKAIDERPIMDIYQGEVAMTAAIFKKYRTVVPLTALVAASTVAAFTGGSSSAAGRELVGTVGPGFTITLTENGEPVTSLRPGTYWLTVHDLATNHNFHIFGEDLDELVTTTPFTGNVTVKILLKHGVYTFRCDPHPGSMTRTFEVGGVGQVD